MNNVQKNQYIFNLYVNPVKKTHQNFLEKTDFRGSNPSRTHKEIRENLSKSFRYLYHVLKNDKNLKKNELYEIFNATTFAKYFEVLLGDNEFAEFYHDFKYDFRTTEIARTMFLISSAYLLQSYQFKNDPYVKDNINRISKTFKSLSKSELEKENPTETLSEELRFKIEDKIYNYEYWNKKYGQSIPHSSSDFELELERRMKQNSINRNTLIDLDIEYNELKSSKNNDKRLKENRNKYNEVLKFKKTEDEFYEKLLQGYSEMEELLDVLNRKYKHISNYFCRLDGLEDEPQISIEEKRTNANLYNIIHSALR